jgi:hypothetical protein
LDTAGNAIKSKKIVDEFGFKNVGLMSTKDHLLNSITLFNNLGFNIKKENSFISEDILAKGAKNPALFVKAYRNTREVKMDRIKEMIRFVLLHTIDRDGKKLGKLTKGRAR